MKNPHHIILIVALYVIISPNVVSGKEDLKDADLPPQCFEYNILDDWTRSEGWISGKLYINYKIYLC